MFWRASPRVRRVMEDVVIISVALSLFFSGWNAFRGSVSDLELCQASAKGREGTRNLVLDLEARRIASNRAFLIRIDAAPVVVAAFEDSSRAYLNRLTDRLERVYPEPHCA